MTLRRWAPILVWALAVAGLAMCVAASFLACSPTWNAPLPVTPTPGAPCGVTGVVCPGAMCCAEGERCGAAHTSCPAGECCFEGGDDEMVGARAPHAQRPASTNPPAH